MQIIPAVNFILLCLSYIRLFLAALPIQESFDSICKAVVTGALLAAVNHQQTAMKTQVTDFM